MRIVVNARGVGRNRPCSGADPRDRNPDPWRRYAGLCPTCFGRHSRPCDEDACRARSRTSLVAVIVSALVFAWEHAKQMGAKSFIDENDVKICELHGPLFFGSIHAFHQLFDPKNDPDHVVVDFYDTRVADHSGLEAIDTLADRYLRAGSGPIQV